MRADGSRLTPLDGSPLRGLTGDGSLTPVADLCLVKRTTHPYRCHMPLSRTLLRLVPLVLIAATSCKNPAADATMIEQMRQLGDELNASRQDAATMHDQLDSLKIVVAKQDTLLRQLAGMANVPVPPR